MPPQDRPSHNKHGATWGQGRNRNQPRGGGGPSLPGQSNADNTTAKLEIHPPTTKVINSRLCQNQNNLMCNYLDGYEWNIFIDRTSSNFVFPFFLSPLGRLLRIKKTLEMRKVAQEGYRWGGMIGGGGRGGGGGVMASP